MAVQFTSVEEEWDAYTTEGANRAAVVAATAKLDLVDMMVEDGMRRVGGGGVKD